MADLNCPCPHFGCEFAYSDWYRNERLVDALISKFKEWHSKYEKGIWSVLRRDDEVLFLRCWTRFDPPSKKKLERKLRRLDFAIGRKPCVLLTLTVEARRHRCPVEALKKAKKAFTKLINWFRLYRKRRNYPDFDYIVVPEIKSRDEKGVKIHIHLHVLLVGIVWLAPSKLIAEKWDELGIGSIVDVRRVRDGVKASSYVLKYLFKTSNDLQNALLYLANVKSYTLSRRLSELVKTVKPVQEWEFLGILYWFDVEKFSVFLPISDEDGNLRFKDPPPEFWSLLEEILYVGR